MEARRHERHTFLHSGRYWCTLCPLVQLLDGPARSYQHCSLNDTWQLVRVSMDHYMVATDVREGTRRSW